MSDSIRELNLCKNKIEKDISQISRAARKIRCINEFSQRYRKSYIMFESVKY